MFRPPVDLPQFDRRACLVCAATNLLYMFHLLDQPDVHWVDQQLKRRPDDFVEEPHILFLLKHGLSVLKVSELDEEMVLQNGIDYLKYFYRDFWREDWDEVYTPALVNAIQEMTVLIETEVATYELPCFIDQRLPTMEDITNFIREGCVVELAIRYERRPYTHTLLVYGVENEKYQVYWPSGSESSLRSLPPDELERLWDGLWLDIWWRG